MRRRPVARLPTNEPLGLRTSAAVVIACFVPGDSGPAPRLIPQAHMQTRPGCRSLDTMWQVCPQTKAVVPPPRGGVFRPSAGVCGQHGVGSSVACRPTRPDPPRVRGGVASPEASQQSPSCRSQRCDCFRKSGGLAAALDSQTSRGFSPIGGAQSAAWPGVPSVSSLCLCPSVPELALGPKGLGAAVHRALRGSCPTCALGGTWPCPPVPTCQPHPSKSRFPGDADDTGPLGSSCGRPLAAPLPVEAIVRAGGLCTPWGIWRSQILAGGLLRAEAW